MPLGLWRILEIEIGVEEYNGKGFALPAIYRGICLEEIHVSS